MMNLTYNSSIPPWMAPPLDAWTLYKPQLLTLFIYYIICFIVGQFVNWICLLKIHRTKLTQSARYLMTTQCLFNTLYLSINFPYKATILYLQRTILPHVLRVFCGWLHLFVVFGSMFLQVSEHTEIILHSELVDPSRHSEAGRGR